MFAFMFFMDSLQEREEIIKILNLVKNVHQNFLYYKIGVQQSLFTTNWVYDKFFFLLTIKCTTKVTTCDHLKRKFVSQYDETFQKISKVYDRVLS